ncbi:MAG: FecR domain-containing protein, partial [Arenicellales bacterium]|nr:FecR domain-containing protein [Arenicellales bacterium]
MNSSDRKILIFPRPWFAPLLGAIVVLASSAPALTLAATGETKVGVTAASNINATGKPPISPARDLETGLEVFFNEKVTTNASGRAQLLFRDGTSLTIGAGSEMVIDKFVFDPASGTGEMAINITKGVFRLVGGKISKKTPVRFNTPTATVAVRGAVVDLAVQANGATAAYLVFGDVLKVTSLATGMSSKTTQAGFFIDNSLKVKKRDRADISKHLSKLERVPNAFSTGGDTDGSGIEHRLSGVAATTSELSGAATSAELAVAANRAASYGSTALGELVDAGLGTHGASGNRPSSNRGSDSSGDGTNSASGSSDSDRSDSVTGESSNDTQESTGDSSDSDTSDPVTDESSSGTQESTDENSGNNTSGSASARTGSTSESTGDPSASSTSDSGSGGSTVRISGGTSGGSASASASGGEEIDCDPRKDKDCKKMALAARAKATGIATMVQASGDRLEFTTTVSSAGA